MGAVKRVRLEANPAQELFLASPADVAVYGGAAGGGKTFALLMEAARFLDNGQFSAVVFRRTFPQITSNGGLWDKASELYTAMGGVPNQADHRFRFRSGAVVTFSHMQHEKDRLNWQGSEIPLICFDELTHFTWRQFSYMLSRNRSTSGIRSYVRGTCNPDPDHWLRSFLDWWIGPDGLPIKERAGVLRWLAVVGDSMCWADSREELLETYGYEIEPLSVTFVPARLDDNPAMIQADPGYKAKLKALPSHEREQLLEGNWDARPAAGVYFQRHWFEVVDAAPHGTRWCRYWDRAATEPSQDNPDPDWTAGGLVGITPDGRVVIGGVVRFRGRPHKVRSAIKNTASADGDDVVVGLEQEPGASGKSEAQELASHLHGFKVKVNNKRTRKESDWAPLSAQAEAGNVMVIRGPWNEALFAELEALGSGRGHDDQADAISGAYNELIKRKSRPMLG